MLGTLLLSLTLLGPQQESAELVLLPDAVLGADGEIHEGWSVVVRDGRIQSVGEAGESSGGVRVRGVLAAGMVDAYGRYGADGRVAEEALQLTPHLRAADAFDPESEALEELLQYGVTSVHLVPQPSNVLAGRGVLLSCAAEVRQEQTVLLGSLVTSQVYDGRVGPTSLAGALELLEQALAAEAGEGDEAAAPPLWLTVAESEGVRGARAVCERLGNAAPSFVAYGDLGSYGGDLAGSLLLMPARAAADARDVESLKRLHKAETRFALGSRDGAGGMDALRAAAMMLSRATGDPAAAWAAVTSHAAEAVGMAGKLGTLAAGAHADLVLWSAHPLDAAARVEAVMIDGKTVWQRGVKKEKE